MIEEYEKSLLKKIKIEIDDVVENIDKKDKETEADMIISLLHIQSAIKTIFSSRNKKLEEY